MAEKTSQNEFWPAKAHIASSLFMDHKLVLTDIAWPIILFSFFGPFFQATQFQPIPIFQLVYFSPYFFSPHISAHTFIQMKYIYITSIHIYITSIRFLNEIHIHYIHQIQMNQHHHIGLQYHKHSTSLKMQYIYLTSIHQLNIHPVSKSQILTCCYSSRSTKTAARHQQHSEHKHRIILLLLL